MAVPTMTNNSPVAGSIAWGLFHIQYMGVGYEVAAGSTSQRWVWWRYNAGVGLVESGADIPLDLTDDDLVLFGNKDGIGARIQSAVLVDGELIVDGSIFAEAIAANTITANEIATDTITADQIATDTITANEIATDTITANEIATDTITANEIATDTITANEIATDTITALEIAADTITALEIAADTITADEIAADTITANEIAAGTITALEIAAGSITTLEIASGTIVADNIKAASITGNLLAADVVLATTRIAAVGGAGQSVELNPKGFYVYGPTSEGNPPYVEFPTEGGIAGKPNIISGTLQATTLSVEGNALTGQAATFRQNSQMEPGATFTLNDSIVAPVAMPIAESIVNEISTNVAVTGALAGMAYHPGEDAVYFITNSRVNFGDITVRLYKIALATNTLTYVRLLKYGALADHWARGIVYFNSAFHVGYIENGNIVVGKYDPAAGWAQTASVNFGAIGGPQDTFTLGHDGTNLWIGDFGSSTASAFRFRKYLNTLSTAVQETINTTHAPSTSARAPTEMFTLNVGAFDFGVRKFVVTFNSATDYGAADTTVAYDMAAFATGGGAREIASEFYLMRKNYEPGLIWRAATPDTAAGKFVGVTYAGAIPYVGYYSGLRFTARSIYWYIGASFHRASDSAETTMSPQALLSMYSRWDWKVTISTPPAGLGSRVYISQSGYGQAVAQLQATLAAGTSTIKGSTHDGAGVLSKVASTFGSSEPSFIRSQAVVNVVISSVARTNTSPTITGTAKFKKWMLNQPLTGTGIPAGATIIAIAANEDSATMSANATSTISGDITFPNQPKLLIRGDGVARITSIDELIIGGNDDVNASAGNSPPLRIGDIGGTHLRIDGNEIVAMTADAVQGTMNVNLGGPVLLGGSAGSVKLCEGDSILGYARGNGTPILDANGNFTVTHGMGKTPLAVVATPGVEGVFVAVRTFNSTTFSGGINNTNGTSHTANDVPLYWIAFA